MVNRPAVHHTNDHVMGLQIPQCSRAVNLDSLVDPLAPVAQLIDGPCREESQVQGYEVSSH